MNFDRSRSFEFEQKDSCFLKTISKIEIKIEMLSSKLSSIGYFIHVFREFIL
jgi:hypothetical protein